MNYATVRNFQNIPLATIPLVTYDEFLETNITFINDPANHCVNYFGISAGERIKLFCCIANDTYQVIYLSSCMVTDAKVLSSFSATHICYEKFERELHENFGIPYSDHPWLKPVRYAYDRADASMLLANYPFYSIDSEELHEVGVGPIHAGIIEPGHFRFLCNGEQILHLEIQLGYSHRGIEPLFLSKRKLLQRMVLSESIAGDSVVAHATTFAVVWEALCAFQPDPELDFVRTLALELERIAIHTGDLSAVCTDIAYQLGSSVFGRLRTPIINFMQQWCGNRLSKGLIRPGQNNYYFTRQLAEELTRILDVFEPDFLEMCRELFHLPSTLARFEKTGMVTFAQATSIGTVGMAARMLGISRDIRFSHPSFLYAQLHHSPVIKHHGDVFSRVQIRKEEIKQSIGYVRQLLQHLPAKSVMPALQRPSADSFVIGMVEGWRGEICHCAITDTQGELICYKVKDPSFHNWLALALSVRNNEISDFPISNKSFDLSYCGHDL